MEESVMNVFSYLNQACNLCYMPYDEAVYAPMMLCLNQHLACKTCFQKQLIKQNPVRCPQCRQVIDPKKVTKFRKLYKVIDDTKDNKTKLKKQYFQHLNIQKNIESSRAEEKSNENDLHNYIKTRQYQLHNLQSTLLNQAISQFKDQKIHKCIATCKIILQNNPQQLMDFIGLGSIEEQTGHYQKRVLKWFNENFKYGHISCYDLIALCFLIQRKFEQQKAWYEHMNMLYPDNYIILYGLAVTYHNKGMIKKASELYQKVIEIEPYFSRSYEMLGFISSQNNNIQQLGKYAQRAHQLDPKNIYALYLLFVFYCTTKRHENYNKIQKQMLQRDKTYVRAILFKGLTKKRSKKYQLAIKHFNTCININRHYSKPLLQKGQCLLQLGNPNQAITTINNYKVLKGSNSRSQFLLGRAFFQLNQYKTAQNHYLRCSQLFPSHDKVYYELADIYKIQNRYQKAIQMYNIDLRYRPQYDQTPLKIAQCYQLLKDYSNAIQCYQKWYNISSNNMAQLKIAMMLFKAQKYTQSLEKCNQCLNLQLPRHDIYEIIFNIYQNQHKRKEICELSGNLLISNTHDSNILKVISRVLNKISEYDEIEEEQQSQGEEQGEEQDEEQDEEIIVNNT